MLPSKSRIQLQGESAMRSSSSSWSSSRSFFSRGASSLALVGTLSLPLLLSQGCSNATEGAVSGAGIGAVSGLAIGSLSGNAGAGAAVGAVVGGVGGAVIGDQNRRRDEAAAAASQKPAPQQQPPPAVAVAQPASSTTVVVVNGSTRQYSTGEALGRLIGKWQVNGTIDAGDGKTLKVSGSATAAIERTYFVRLDTKFTDPRSGQPVEGTTMISQTGGKGIELTNSFSTSPEMKTFKGSVDQSGTIYTLTQSDPPAAQRRLTVRTAADRTWTAEVWDGNQRLESYTFSPI
jgi:hypothetical protein